MEIKDEIGIQTGETRRVAEEMRLNSVQEQIRKLADETGASACGCVQPIVVHGNPAIEILAKAHE
jgi:hypothetical protein